jgi:hypothetical protein
VAEIYTTGAPTFKEIICLYLYGERTPPALGRLRTLADIKAYKNVPPAVVEIDKYWFMTRGGGRFISIGRFNFVMKFLERKDKLPGGTDVDKTLKGALSYPNPTQRQTYMTRVLLEKYKAKDLTGAFGLRQYEYETNNPDFMDRAEAFGSSEFVINPFAEFIIEPNGDRWIRNIWVDPKEDNYDYTSSTGIAMVSNFMAEPIIDPLGIGRTVTIKFTGSYAKCHNGNPKITENDLPALKSEAKRLIERRNSWTLEQGARLHIKKMRDLDNDGVFYARNFLHEALVNGKTRPLTLLLKNGPLVPRDYLISETIPYNPHNVPPDFGFSNWR